MTETTATMSETARLKSGRSPRILGAASIGLGAAMLLGGCADAAPSASATAEPTAGAEVPSDEATATGDDVGSTEAAPDADATGVSDDAEMCGVTPDDPRITEAIANVPAPFSDPAHGNVAWSTTIVDTDFDPCAELSYAVITVDGATVASPMQVMLFGRGEYLGTTSDCAPGFQTVEQSAPDAVAVTYEWPKPGEPNAGEKDSATVTYSLSNGEIVMSDPIPDEAVDEGICHTWPPK